MATRLVLIHNDHIALYVGREQKAIWEVKDLTAEDIAYALNHKEES